ncbi:MAG: bifunctional phosphoribosylaminoimidazolecarboxamide formyltransferase/IMP cyclohydrolase [Planctomycetota bacterium]|nr:bifunctional phosphoribosylaminoimidazolecarboxamide formyltransferase/IMP cyclohydrolase [Planctomycetota bacterium]
MSEQHQRALISVSNKEGLAEFALGLVDLGFELISTGGTRRFLEEREIPVIDISSYTGFPEIMDGRVKTLHPKVHGAILGRPDLDTDRAAIQEHGIVPFQVVVCNLYPFEDTIAKSGVTIPEAIEQIDIGGPSMVRSAAKNHAYVAIVSQPEQYVEVLERLRSNRLDQSFRRQLAAAAFEVTASYDRAIADYMATITDPANDDSDCVAEFPEKLSLNFVRRFPLRYGENPHQSAAFYVESDAAATTLAGATQRNGKELSYNNLLDLDAALSIVREFAEPAAVVIKHNNPCGCAIAESLAEAFDRAYAGDPVSAFGSIISFNRPVDLATVEHLCEPNRFVEAIIAPGYEPAAFEALTTRPKWKKNVRLLECPWPDSTTTPGSLDYRRIAGGLLVQDRDDQLDPEVDWKVVTERQPTDAEWRDLRFGWKLSKHVKSNAIVYVRDGAVVGVGAGQMSRLDSAHIAGYKSEGRAQGGSVASDAFFPFRDGIDEAAKAGIVAVIEPGGSVRDDEVIAACNEHGMAMVFTGRRHFKH